MIVISLKSSETPMHNAPKVFLSSKTPNTEEQFRTISLGLEKQNKHSSHQEL